MQNAKFRAMQYAKNFELESEKVQLKSLEFICKALALDSELIQILTSLNLEYQNYLN